MEIIRGRLKASDVVPANIRYNDGTSTVQTTPDNGATWVDNAAADPRKADAARFPALTTSDPQCDAAANMVKWVKDTIDGIIAALAGGATAFTTANLFLQRLSLMFPPALFLVPITAVASDLFDLGATALDDAFPSTVYDDLLCLFYCAADMSGQISASALTTLEAQIVAQLDTLPALIVNEMLFLTGEVGLSNAGTIGGLTGDCSGCADCDWVVEYDFSIQNYGFNVLFSGNQPRGYYTGHSFIGTNQGGTICLFLFKQDAGLEITGMAAYCTLNHGTGLGSLHRTMNLLTASPVSVSTIGSAGVTDQATPGWQTDTPTFTSTQGWAIDWNGSSNGTGSMEVFKMRLRGTGQPPPDGIRVPSL